MATLSAFNQTVLRSRRLIGCALALLAAIASGQQLDPGKPVDSLDRNYADQLPRIPSLSLDESLESFQMEAGFRMEIVAAEPHVADPVAIAFDEVGRMFVAEMRGYSEQGEQNLGVIRLLEDRDNDGRFETSTVFAEGLSWPTAIICTGGGVLVGAAPEIILLRDTDGDGKADKKETVFKGFHRTNVQGLLNSFRWSLENRIYGATSSSGANVTAVRHPKMKPLLLRRRDFMIDPRDMSIVATSGGGQHGQSFDDYGRRYVCSNSNHLQLVMYEDRYLARSPYLKAPAANVSIAVDGPQAPVFRSSPIEPWRIVRTNLRVKGLVPGPVEGGGKPAGYFTGATGATIYRGNAFGAEYVGNAFVADCGSNLVHRKVIESTGIGATARRATANGEFLTSSDIWFRPVQMANAPDGTLYVLDMSREVIEHPKSLPPIIKQHLDLTSGRERGRIYRIVPNDFKQPPPVRLGEASGEELVAMLEHANGWHRDTAARLIYERGDRLLVPLLEKLSRDSERPEGRIHAIYAINSLGGMEVDSLLERLADEHPRVREHAIRIAESHAADSPRLRERLYSLANDPDQRVRYQLAFSLGEFRGAGRIEALVKILRHDLSDHWVSLAVASSAVDDQATLFEQLAQAKQVLESEAGRQQLLSLAGRIASRARDDDMAIVLHRILKLEAANQTLASRLVQTLAANAGDNRALREQLASVNAGKSEQFLSTLIADATKTALDTEQTIERRQRSIGALRIAKFADVKPTLTALIDPVEPTAIQVAALATLREFSDPAAIDFVLARFASMSPAIRAEALESLTSSADSTRRLLSEIEAGRFAMTNVGLGHRKLLVEHADEAIATRAEKLFGSTALSPRSEVIRRYQRALTLDGDLARGRMIFRKTCAACHRLEDHGHRLGKELKSIGDRGAATIMTNVLDPNREVDPAYLNYTAVTQDGRIHTGVIVAETAASLTFQRAGGVKETLPRTEIDQLKSTGQSIMPEGLEKEIDLQGMADLLAYLLTQ